MEEIALLSTHFVQEASKLPQRTAAVIPAQSQQDQILNDVLAFKIFATIGKFQSIMEDVKTVHFMREDKQITDVVQIPAVSMRG